MLQSNPYGLALIRMCKHAYFTITALCACAPPLSSKTDNESVFYLWLVSVYFESIKFEIYG
jgi:hypothetical protein